MGAVATGDGGALRELARRYERPLFAFLSRHTGGRDVDDLYGFIACYRGRAISVARSHERMSPSDRAASVHRFSHGVVRVLVATHAFAPSECALQTAPFVICCNVEHALASTLLDAPASRRVLLFR